MHVQQDDIAIIEQVLKGQQHAYSVLVVRYQQYVFTLAMRYVNDRELAEELSQDVFVKAYRCLADFKGNSKFSTWLYTIVHTTCLSHLRKKKTATILLEEERMIPLSDGNLAMPPDNRLEQKAAKALLERAIKQLPEADGEIIALFYMAEQSVEEIGVIMGMTASNVKVRLHRARQQLKDVISPALRRELLIL